MRFDIPQNTRRDSRVGLRWTTLAACGVAIALSCVDRVDAQGIDRVRRRDGVDSGKITDISP
ncbi:MAG: hypothetical protein KDA61_20865, partial [Planctomycetales bacterium]|nr:hypothetical protein [Planctomycetales bacterium]